MFTPGPTELILIISIILILFGVGKIPEVGAGIGKGLRNFRKALKGEDEIDITPTKTTPVDGEETQAADPPSE